MNNKNYRRIKDFNLLKNKAFTLVELMVTISIFLIITSVTLINYSGFKSSVSLQNETDTIALSIRKAQSYAIGAKGISGAFTNSYGIHFATSGASNILGSSKSFVLFSNSSGIYPPGLTGTCATNSSLCVEQFTITGINRVNAISVNGGSYVTGSIDIAFKRPEARAIFCYRSTATMTNSTCDSVGTISNVKIRIWNGKLSPDAKFKYITVQNTGQISIQ